MVKAPDAPFTEEDVLKHIRSWRWLKIKVGDCNLIQMNWVVTLLASICLLCFIIIGANKDTQDDLIDTFRVKGQPWITQNFTWLYIATQDVWVCFLIWCAPPPRPSARAHPPCLAPALLRGHAPSIGRP